MASWDNDDDGYTFLFRGWSNHDSVIRGPVGNYDSFIEQVQHLGNIDLDNHLSFPVLFWDDLVGDLRFEIRGDDHIFQPVLTGRRPPNNLYATVNYILQNEGQLLRLIVAHEWSVGFSLITEQDILNQRMSIESAVFHDIQYDAEQHAGRPHLLAASARLNALHATWVHLRTAPENTAGIGQLELRNTVATLSFNQDELQLIPGSTYEICYTVAMEDLSPAMVFTFARLNLDN